MKRWRMGLQDSAARAFRGPDGAMWTVEVRAPGASNAMVVFLHADRTARRDRYAWWNSASATAGDVTGRVGAADVLAQLDDRALLRLWGKSMSVDSSVPRFEPG
jgi:hypothetical protein